MEGLEHSLSDGLFFLNVFRDRKSAAGRHLLLCRPNQDLEMEDKVMKRNKYGIRRVLSILLSVMLVVSSPG